MNPCEHWEELLSARLDGPLTQEEARQLEDHLYRGTPLGADFAPIMG